VATSGGRVAEQLKHDEQQVHPETAPGPFRRVLMRGIHSQMLLVISSEEEPSIERSAPCIPLTALLLPNAASAITFGKSTHAWKSPPPVCLPPLNHTPVFSYSLIGYVTPEMASSITYLAQTTYTRMRKSSSSTSPRVPYVSSRRTCLRARARPSLP